MNLKPEELHALITFYAKRLTGENLDYASEGRKPHKQMVLETVERLAQLSKELP